MESDGITLYDVSRDGVGFVPWFLAGAVACRYVGWWSSKGSARADFSFPFGYNPSHKCLSRIRDEASWSLLQKVLGVTFISSKEPLDFPPSSVSLQPTSRKGEFGGC